MPGWLTLIIFLIVIAALVVTVLGTLMALWILRPQRLTDGRAVYLLRRLSPDDLKIPYTIANFTVRDRHGRNLLIAGWLMPAPGALSDRCVILLHGYGDAKVGSIAWAPIFAGLHCNILAIDLRAHGESGGSYTTGGYFERDDVAQVINQVRALYPAETKQLILFGASLGSAVAAAVAVDRDDIAGVILDSPIISFRHANRVYSNATGMPVGLLFRLAMWIGEKISGADFEAVRTADMLPKIHCPILIITGGEDPFTPEPALKTFDDALVQRPPGTTMRWHLPDAIHLAALYEAGDEYRRHVEEFLAQVSTPASN